MDMACYKSDLLNFLYKENLLVNELCNIHESLSVNRSPAKKKAEDHDRYKKHQVDKIIHEMQQFRNNHHVNELFICLFNP